MRVCEKSCGGRVFQMIVGGRPRWELQARKDHERSEIEQAHGQERTGLMVYESSVRTWSFVPDAIDAATLVEAFMWFTPRYRPAEFLNAYRSRIAALKQTASAYSPSPGPRGKARDGGALSGTAAFQTPPP